MRTRWAELQKIVASCRRCEVDLPDIGVDCPPRLVYPDGLEPPNPLKVLFVGVAPPKTGYSFHTDPSDNLWLGLSSVLQELRRPCASLAAFYDRGFFLVHTAKCAIRGTTSPHPGVSRLCSSIHLSKEIDCLAPEAVCWLSKNVCFPVSRAEAARRGFPGRLNFGVPLALPVGDKTVPFLATAWPGRGWQEVTRPHLESLFALLRIPEW